MPKSVPKTCPYTTVAQFLSDISQQYPSLSRQLKAVGRYIEQNRDHVALDRIQDMAERCLAQPSAIVRFAKHFGFSGFTDMQQLFRDGMTQQIAPGRSYQDRIRDLIESTPEKLSLSTLSHEVIGGGIASLEALSRDLDPRAFDAAVSLLEEAPAVWIVASRRSFPVGAYLAYALQHTSKAVHWMSGVGHMQEGQLRGLGARDVMIAISFIPYADETVATVTEAVARGARVIAISDSQMSPIAQAATATLVVQESSTFGFRSLTSTMSLVQSLFIALAYKLELRFDASETGAAQARASP